MICPNCSDVEMNHEEKIRGDVYTCPDCGYSETR